MANCQNNMRYGRSGNMYQQRSSYMNQRQMQEYRNTSRCNEHRMPESCHTVHRDECSIPESYERERKHCSCEHHADVLTGMPLAMAYVPWQKWCEIYDICEGFSRGTIFCELDKPFCGRGGCNR